jgi:opacity protein-like surface antigen
MFISKLRSFLVIALCAHISLAARDILLEFKAAYFLPTDSDMRHIYNNGGALYGPEVTFKLGDSANWYGFASIDYFQKNGRSLGLCDTTQVSLLPLGIGLKYMASYCGWRHFYVGLGFQPVYLKTENCSPFVIQKTSKWGFGGIAKIGAYFDLPKNFVIDLFFDYSFVKVDCSSCSDLVIPVKADISGAIFGVGLGYRFN